MNPLDQYELLETLTSDAERETFKAREISTGRSLFIHYLRATPPGVPLGKSLLELAQYRLQTGMHSLGSAMVYQAGGRYIVVTPATPEYLDPRSCLERSVQDHPGISSSRTSAENGTPGEFTQLFGKYSESSNGPAPRTLDPGPAVPDSISAPPRQSRPTEPIGKPAESGEFTRMFVMPPKTRIADVWQKTAVNDPFFPKPNIPVDDRKPAEKPIPDNSDSLFGSQTPRPYGNSVNSAANAVEPDWSRKLEMSLNTDSAPGPIAPAPFTMQPPLQTGPQTPTGPGEYTMVISASRNSPPPAPLKQKAEVSVPAPVAPSSKDKSSLKLIVILNVFGVVAIIWILYFVLVSFKK